MTVHEILRSTEFTGDEKYVMLKTEYGFGSMRAQQLVFGYIKYPKEPYKNKEAEEDILGRKIYK